MMRKVLLLDDDVNILRSYQRVMRNKYELLTFESAQEAIDAFQTEGPFAVVVSDYRMPEMDGVEFLAVVKKISPDSVRIMLSGQADKDVAVEAVNQGNIFRFLNKPCPVEEFLNHVKAAVEQYELVMAERELLDNTLKGSIRVLIDILSIVSPLAFKQASRLPVMARKVASRLQVERQWEMELAAMLSQIGCVTIPVQILEKRDKGIPLNEWEAKMFSYHPQTGKNLLAKIPRLENIAEAIGDQLKRYEEEGPVHGRQISLLGRILKAVLDLDGIQQTGKSRVEALEIMRSNYDWYDPNVFAALEAELMNVEEGYIVKSVWLRDVVPGMVTAEAVKDVKGVDLIPAGTEISDVLHMRLLNFAKIAFINEPVKILETTGKHIDSEPAS